MIGPDDARIAQRTHTVRDGERCELPDLGLGFEILQVPGHTLSHIAFWGHGALFCGDTLFSAGCGRMFEGTPEQMNASLNRLRDLPPDTRMYCGHEYTAANLRFALTVDPANAAARDYRDRVDALRAADAPPCPPPWRWKFASIPSCAAMTRACVPPPSRMRAGRSRAGRGVRRCCAPGRISSADGITHDTSISRHSY